MPPAGSTGDSGGRIVPGHLTQSHRSHIGPAGLLQARPSRADDVVHRSPDDHRAVGERSKENCSAFRNVLYAFAGQAPCVRGTLSLAALVGDRCKAEDASHLFEPPALCRPPPSGADRRPSRGHGWRATTDPEATTGSEPGRGAPGSNRRGKGRIDGPRCRR